MAPDEPRSDGPRDDRGAPCRLADLSARQVGWRALGLRSVTPDFITKSEQSHTDATETRVALGGGVFGLLLHKFILWPAFSPLLPGWADWLGMFLAAVVFAVVAWWLFLGRIRVARATRIIEIYLSVGLCASCGYALDNLEPEPDACLVCPECNAAWREDRGARRPGMAPTTGR